MIDSALPSPPAAFGLYCHDSLEQLVSSTMTFCKGCPFCSRFWTRCLRDFPTLQPTNDARPKNVAPHIAWVYGSVSLLSIIPYGCAMDRTGPWKHGTLWSWNTGPLFPWMPRYAKTLRLRASFHDFARNVMLTIQLPGLAVRHHEKTLRCDAMHSSPCPRPLWPWHQRL